MDKSTVGQAQVQETMGLDIGDRESRYCILDAGGEVISRGRVPTTKKAINRMFADRKPLLVAIEAGTHSAWVSRVFGKLGHSVLVANPRKLRIIYESHRKNDVEDAERLARVARLDPTLLSPICHRDEATQTDLAMLRSRDALVAARTQLVNHVRGAVKSSGERLRACSTGAFARRASEELPEDLRTALGPVVEQVDSLTSQIRDFDRQVQDLARTKYPAVERVASVPGVGSLTALAYVLTIQDPGRFPRSRSVAAYLGLVPRQADSGESTPQLRITKAGDSMLRKLLVGSAQYTLGPFGPDSDLRQWGLALAERGGKNAKKRAVIAVARKLAVLLLRLWVTGQEFKPFRVTPPETADASTTVTASRTGASEGKDTQEARPQLADSVTPGHHGGGVNHRDLEEPAATKRSAAASSSSSPGVHAPQVTYVLRKAAATERGKVNTRGAASPGDCRSQGSAVDAQMTHHTGMETAPAAAASPASGPLADGASPRARPRATRVSTLARNPVGTTTVGVPAGGTASPDGAGAKGYSVDHGPRSPTRIGNASRQAVARAAGSVAESESPTTHIEEAKVSTVAGGRVRSGAPEAITGARKAVEPGATKGSAVGHGKRTASGIEDASRQGAPPPAGSLPDSGLPSTQADATKVVTLPASRDQSAPGKVNARLRTAMDDSGSQGHPVGLRTAQTTVLACALASPGEDGGNAPSAASGCVPRGEELPSEYGSDCTSGSARRRGHPTVTVAVRATPAQQQSKRKTARSCGNEQMVRTTR